MNFFSAIGDGEGFFQLNVIFFAIGLHYEFAFLTMAFCANAHIISFLKTFLQHSRPQFDDPTIGVVSNSSICSGEFGNPSGHAMMTTQHQLTALFFFRQVYEEWLKKNKFATFMLELIVFVYISGVCFCRLYLGRHGLDQIFVGIELGAWSAFFFNDTFKKYFYDPVFCPDDSENPKITVARSFKAFKITSFIYLAVVVKMVALFIWVDNTAEIS